MEKWEISCRFKNIRIDNYFTIYINQLIAWLLSSRGLWGPGNLFQKQLSWVLWGLVPVAKFKPNISVCLSC